MKYAEDHNGYYFQLPGEKTSLTIAKGSGAIAANEGVVAPGGKEIAAIVGTIRLLASQYIIVASKTETVGAIFGQQVHRVTAFEILPLNGNSADPQEQQYLKILQFHLDSSRLYFCRTWDLTTSLQAQSHAQRAPGVSFQTADERFFWNKYVCTDLMDAALTQPGVGLFVTPMTFGFVELTQSTMNGRNVTFGLITRRSRHRAGTRYFRRGIDAHGNVANFNETEQLLIVEGTAEPPRVYSYLQTRGSVPVYWGEVINLKYKPNLQIGQPAADAAKQHFDDQVKRYGRNYLVNLVNQKGYELPVKQAYEQLVSQLGYPEDQVSYVYFDFHHECSKMRWHRVLLLIEKLQELGLDNQGYFEASLMPNHQLQPQANQTSVVRTNCMDCLDRTNVVQSTFGRWVLQKQFEAAGILAPGQKWESANPNFELVFRNVWADNANAVSVTYSGTGALKTDFTRLGKRTKQGALNDGLNSATRYIKNNFQDGIRQDSFDLFLGNYVPYSGRPARFYDARPILFQAVPYMILSAVVLILCATFFPRQDLSALVSRSFVGFWVLVLVWSVRYMTKNGLQFVNWPKLIKPDFVSENEIVNNGKVSGVVYKVGDSDRVNKLD
ncbi:Phosphoinositide phosphatase SAC1 [Yarrowia sp. C11]|nr:Phosphoinositide phosphatase SAC1 [Yarrowia sp. E02]KAG5369410.1 Phosphoinositide phosphatase SAC1 [Yarrowia sp. C11]